MVWYAEIVLHLPLWERIVVAVPYVAAFVRKLDIISTITKKVIEFACDCVKNRILAPRQNEAPIILYSWDDKPIKKNKKL